MNTVSNCLMFLIMNNYTIPQLERLRESSYTPYEMVAAATEMIIILGDD